ncbi:unnamed protein product [Ostreobium quekettii]|uniref:20 kDa chaperonin, chloroplastic n=1 Tax=Ostreobium quekettii TaxID=121088 RepID=A0A8S1J6Y1_9CHLO|nr:unnamed protein product [Ostreobium quekettii]|eukprot:evm.model.scf_231.4 EVM.evm.TU.scf_231.4   scf_231:64755-68389(-)
MFSGASWPSTSLGSGLARGRRCSRPLRQPPRVVAESASLKIPDKFAKVTPRGEYVYVKAGPEEEKTLGGILLPPSAAQKPTTGTVVELGDGKVGSKTVKFSLKENDTVLYSKFGFMYTELDKAGERYLLIREEDVIGTLPTRAEDATADDCAKLQPLGDRVLLKIVESSDLTAGGVILPESAKERPMLGEVVRVGPGKEGKDGEIVPCKVKPGELVLYFKYAGDAMETLQGEKYIVLHETDILCKA